jgi:hypothetical protein
MGRMDATVDIRNPGYETLCVTRFGQTVSQWGTSQRWVRRRKELGNPFIFEN